MSAFIIKPTTISLFPAGKPPIFVSVEHPNFNAVKEALLANNFDLAVSRSSLSQALTFYANGRIRLVNGTHFYYNDQPLPELLSTRMVEFFQANAPIHHFIKFVENLYENPSHSAVNELYLFLEAANLPITEDGHFLAYKAVTSDFKDFHTRTFDNSPGLIVSMPRNQVDDNRNVTCSRGLHAASYSYAVSFMAEAGSRLIAVKINPRDVVSVPVDHNNEKLRTCRYEVLYEVPFKRDILTGRPFVSSTLCGND